MPAIPLIPSPPASLHPACHTTPHSHHLHHLNIFIRLDPTTTTQHIPNSRRSSSRAVRVICFLSQYCEGIGHSPALSFLMLPKKYISETDRTMPCQSSPIACRSSLEEARYIACRPCPPPRPSRLMRNGRGITLPNIFLAGNIYRVTP